MKIYIIRHGETSWNRERRLQGQQGADLDEEGVLLAEMTAEALKDVPFDICYSSPLVRALHTAEIMVGDRRIPIVKEPRIMEIGFGIWEGKSCDMNHLEIPLADYLQFHEDSYNYQPPEGGESIRQVIDRCTDFLQEVMQNPDLADKTILVSTHGCATRAILNSVYDDNTDYWHGGVPMNCAVSMLEVTDGKPELILDDAVYYPEKYYHKFYDEQRAELEKKDNH